MKVLSLFDGISCGRVALERAGIPVEAYDAFEVDAPAITISENNYPDITHHGDVFNGDFTQFKGHDLLIGGSPCTYWSIAQRNRETTSSGIGFDLFMQYSRALTESRCEWFLYENNNSIHPDIKHEISRELGVKPVMINSSLVSAQYRKRCYWTNIPNVQQPADRGITLQGILENGLAFRDKSYAYTTRCQAGTIEDTMKRHRHTMVAVPYDSSGQAPMMEPVERMKRMRSTDRIYEVKNGEITLMNGTTYPIRLPDGYYSFRRLTPMEAERLQTLPDGYTEGVPNSQRYKCIGNGWTVNVITHILTGLVGQ